MADLGRAPRETVAAAVAEAREHVTPRWTAERERRVRMAIEARRGLRRGRRPWMLSFAAATAAAVALLLVWSSGLGPLPAAPTAAREGLRAVSEPRVLFGLSDGTAVTALSPDARVEATSVEPSTVTVRLAAGAARFSVTPNPQRKLRVLSGSTVVTVLGTVFDVSRSKSGVSVAVERGRVHVAWPDGARVLGAGETLAVPDPEASPQTELQVAPKPDDGATAAAVAPELAGAGGSEPPAGPGGMPRAAAPPSPQATASWRTLAQDGNYAGALARITQSGPESVKNEPGDLLLAADVARLGGQPERAVAWLERVVRAHASDSRAALAAFTLGRTLMDQLGRPREAAIAFAEARKLGKGGALAEDALAREVEGWSRAGEATLARQRALEYVERYPKGRRRAAVKRLGELE